MSLAILMLAAGASSRMQGRDKLLERIDGQPLLALQIARARHSGAPLVVTHRPGDAARLALLTPLAGADLRLVPVPDAAEGMAASLRAGVAALGPEVSAVMVLLPDMPDIDVKDLETMRAAHAAHPTRVIQATAACGTPGHPVIFPRSFFPALEGLSGDRGAKPVLAKADPLRIPLPDRHAVTDLDTPRDWADWRAARG